MLNNKHLPYKLFEPVTFDILDKYIFILYQEELAPSPTFHISMKMLNRKYNQNVSVEFSAGIKPDIKYVL